jgi:hypothetical protein
MKHSLKTLTACAVTSAFLFIPATSIWAAHLQVTAHTFAQGGIAEVGDTSSSASIDVRARRSSATIPTTVRFQEVSGRGLLVSVWINGSGPYTFAVDTGAGATILSARVAREARVATSGSRSLIIGGISERGATTGHEVSLGRIAVGDSENVLPSRGRAVVIDELAPGLDGVLDPAEAYWPLGFEVDMPRGLMSAFDPRSTPLRRMDATPEAAVVPWLADGGTRRPFVALGSGRRALIDTGSGLGLGVTVDAAMSLGIAPGRGRSRVEQIRDLGGGTVAAHRIAPTNISIGPLILNGIPTDLLPDASASSPIILGRDALRPFRITFDPINRLVRFIAE